MAPYIVAQGLAALGDGTGERLPELGGGQAFGKTALLTGVLRTATVATKRSRSILSTTAGTVAPPFA